jgi:hypothetical protein
MKLYTEDDEEREPVDDFLALLVFLWRGNYSVNLAAGLKELHVYPQPSTGLAEWIQSHFSQLQRWLPGVCDGCPHPTWVMERTEMPYGAHAHLCPKCVMLSVEIFERQGVWPEPIWYDGELGIDEA